MRLKNWQLPLALVLFMTGILLMSVLQVLHNQDETPAQEKNHNLVAMIKRQEKELNNLEKSIDTRRVSLDKYQKSLSSGQLETENLQYQLDQLKMLSGVSDVEGPGITVILDDNKKGYEVAKSKNPEANAQDYLIHDKHLLYIVYELRVGGAEAISINKQRITASSDIRCIGTMIQVNTKGLAPPYVINAIGDSSRMASVLENTDSQYNILKMAGYPVQIEKHDKVVIGSYKGSYQFSYAQPKEEQ